LFHLNRHEEALACYRRAIELHPDYAFAYTNLGVTLHQLGREEEAKTAFEKAVALAPEVIEFHYNMADSKRFAADDPQLAQLERLAESQKARPAEDQIKLHFVLAKAYDDLGQHRRAFEQLSQGNALMRRQVAYDEAGSQRFFERVRSVFTAELLAAKACLGHPSAAPVFIVGMPRSGTTLVEQILAAHPRVFAAGELNNLSNAVAALRAPDGRAIAYPELAQSIDRMQLFELGAAYLAGLPAPLPLPDRITDKMPGNFTMIGLIRMALPNAHIIHVRRDPLDTCFSIYSKLFVAGQAYSYDLGELGRYYRDYQRLMAHWNAVLPPGAMLEVRYEDLVGDFESQARRLVEHCGLEWDQRCLAFHEAVRPIRTASFTQVRQPIYTSSIGRSRPYREMLGPLVKALALALLIVAVRPPAHIPMAARHGNWRAPYTVTASGSRQTSLQVMRSYAGRSRSISGVTRSRRRRSWMIARLDSISASGRPESGISARYLASMSAQAMPRKPEPLGA
jgi:tetratricopeptide (TPR) repeat protein